MARISVIVPVYLAAETLARCTDSILNQTFTGLELLLVEDGSPDNSGALCDAIASRDARVRVFHKDNGGVSAARNVGLREATGDYVAFADADDWLAPHALEVLHDALTSAGADTAGCAHFNAMPSGEAQIEPAALPAGVYGQAEIRSGIVGRLLGERLGKPDAVLDGYIWRFLYSRALIANHGLAFSGPYLEDEIFLMEYLCVARKLAMTDEPLYYYLQNPASVTRTYLPDFMDTFRRVVVAKKALADRFGLEYPGWEHSTNWAGLLMAIGLEYAPSNPASERQKRAHVRSFTELPEMARAISALTPTGLDRNKQLVADLVRRRWFLLLGLLYAFKNRGRYSG